MGTNYSKNSSPFDGEKAGPSNKVGIENKMLEILNKWEKSEDQYKILIFQNQVWPYFS